MANAAHISAGSWTGVTRHNRHRHTAPSFQQVLARAQRDGSATRMPVTRAVAMVPLASASAPSAKPLPADADAALTQAMALENVPASWKSGLSYIMAHESSGQVDARNPVHSARGLYQLTRANWHLNPHGAASFGNGVEEAQGGIRYIRSRYGSADNAMAFWQQHHWY